jgi:hypothetical protein
MQPHTTDTIPTTPSAIVRVDLGDGCPVIDRADAFNWGPGAGPEGEGRIQGFEVLEVPQRTAARTARPTSPVLRQRAAPQQRQRRAISAPHLVCTASGYTEH